MNVPKHLRLKGGGFGVTGNKGRGLMFTMFNPKNMWKPSRMGLSMAFSLETKESVKF